MSFPVFSETVCPLVPGPAWWVPASAVRPPEVATMENSQEAIDALGVTPAGPDSDIPIVQHAMPCICPKFDIPTGEPTIQTPFKGTESPYAPGIKTWGVASGKRSTIVGASKTKGDVDWVIAYDLDGSPIYPNPEHPEFHLRLKGSGMWLPTRKEPFPGITLQPLPSFRHPEYDETIEVRGTAFPKTAASEIINCPIINAMMEKMGLHYNNVPLGLWYYAPVVNDPAPNIPKVCDVLKTYGDRRLESNVFAGLEKTILGSLDEDAAEEICERVRALYAAYNLPPPSCTNHTFRRSQTIRCSAVKQFIQEHMGKTDGGTIDDLDDASLAISGIIPAPQIYMVIGDEVTFPDGRHFSLLAKLFGRLAWEAGRCIAIVHRCGFDWGTYQDHFAGGMLCNAHADNIALVPEHMMDLGDGRYQLLFPTDFDMSFRKEQAVDVWHDVPSPDPEFVEQIPPTEFSCMMSNMAGYTAALDKVATAISKRDPDEPSRQMDVIWCMRDICVWEYVQGYLCPGEPGPPENDLTLADALKFIPEAVRNVIDVIV